MYKFLRRKCSLSKKGKGGKNSRHQRWIWVNTHVTGHQEKGYDLYKVMCCMRNPKAQSNPDIGGQGGNL